MATPPAPPSPVPSTRSAAVEVAAAAVVVVASTMLPKGQRSARRSLKFVFTVFSSVSQSVSLSLLPSSSPDTEGRA